MTTEKINRSNELTIEKLKSVLCGFTGSECYYRHPLGLRYTDGVKHLAELARAYWLLDVIASWQPEAVKIDDEFQLWELTVNADSSAVLCFKQDSNLPAAIKQEIEYTDFPVGSFKLYVEQGIVLLPSEH